MQVNGQLVPTGGGDPIPLENEVIVLGRREACDVCLNFPNISGRHCELEFRDGYWYVRDLNSTNGIKVNGTRVQEKLLHPTDELTVGKRTYLIQYQLPAGKRALEEIEEDVLSQGLLEKAGLEKPKHRKKSRRRRTLEDSATDYLLGDDD